MFPKAAANREPPIKLPPAAVSTLEGPRHLRISVPALPPQLLSANMNPHWGTRHRAVSKLKSDMVLIGNNARTLHGWATPARAAIKVTFVYRMRRNRDVDNLLRLFKPFQDSLVQSKLVKADDTDHLMVMSPDVRVSKEWSGMIIDITAI